MNQVSSIEATFGRVIVTHAIYALLVSCECINSLISSRHVLSRSLPLHIMRHSQLVLEVAHVFCYLLVWIKTAVGLGDVSVTACAVIIIIDGLTQNGRVNVLTLASLIFADVHGDATGVLLARRVVMGAETAVIIFNVQVTACSIDLIHRLKRIIALINNC